MKYTNCFLCLQIRFPNDLIGTSTYSKEDLILVAKSLYDFNGELSKLLPTLPNVNEPVTDEESQLLNLHFPGIEYIEPLSVELKEVDPEITAVVASVNIQGLTKSKFPQIQTLQRMTQATIITIQESWIELTDSSIIGRDVQIPGWAGVFIPTSVPKDPLDSEGKLVK